MTKRMLLLLLLLISFDVNARERVRHQAPGPAYSEPVDENANDKASCAAKWERYRKSQECFAPYRNTNGSLKPGAFENCTDVPYPADCPHEN